MRLLGEFAVHHGDRRVDLPPACQRLVALVALKRRPVHRLWVCATLWPKAHTRRATASLRSALWRLRPVGADPLLAVDPQYLQLSPVSDLLPLLRAGDLLDRWVERWVTNDRDRYHAMRKTAFKTIADSFTTESGAP